MNIMTIQTDNADTGRLLKDLLAKISGVSIISEERDIIGFKDKKPVFAENYKAQISEKISKIEGNSEKSYSPAEVLAEILKK